MYPDTYNAEYTSIKYHTFVDGAKFEDFILFFQLKIKKCNYIFSKHVQLLTIQNIVFKIKNKLLIENMNKIHNFIQLLSILNKE